MHGLHNAHRGIWHMTENALKNRRVLIRNIEDGQTIADTQIIRYDSVKNSIYIGAGSLSEIKNYNVSAFIFAKDCLYKFYGTIKNVTIDNEIEVILMEHTDKEQRSKTRYPVELEGNIDGIIVEGITAKLRKSINIHIINMSANGILLKADFGCFAVGDCFALNLKLEDCEIQLDCKIVRVQKSNMLTEEYGCRITGIEIEKESMQESIV